MTERKPLVNKSGTTNSHVRQDDIIERIRVYANSIAIMNPDIH